QQNITLQQQTSIFQASMTQYFDASKNLLQQKSANHPQFKLPKAQMNYPEKFNGTGEMLFTSWINEFITKCQINNYPPFSQWAKFAACFLDGFALEVYTKLSAEIPNFTTDWDVFKSWMSSRFTGTNDTMTSYMKLRQLRSDKFP